MSAVPSAAPSGADAADPAERRPRNGFEVLAVLVVSFGFSALDALLSFVRTQVTVQGGFANAQVPVVTHAVTTYPWLDLLDDLAGILHGLGPPLLVLVLLARDPGGPGLSIGLDRARLRELAQGAGFCALIGLPGLGLIWLGRQFGFNGQIIAVSFPDVWYRIPVLLLDAFQNGAAEEIVVSAYLITRLLQMGWSRERTIIASATLRGSYHLYQGYGGFAGNLVMGLIFAWWFQRTRRVVPLVVAHFLLDAVSFVGYLYLAPHISWL